MNPAPRLANDLLKEDGFVSVWNVMIVMTMLAIGGFAIDHSRVVAEQTRLQVAADAAAHAAAWDLVDFDPDGDIDAQLAAARDAGMVYAAANLGDGRPSSILGPDIEFGFWDDAAKAFTKSSSNVDAVRVTSYRVSSRSDPLPTTYLGLVGLKSFDLAKDSVFQLQLPACAMDGITACNKVELSSGNKFDSCYCVHGNQGVELNNGNIFEPCVTVSMANLSTLVGSTASNPGLDEALRQTSYCPAEATSAGITETIDNLTSCKEEITKNMCGAGTVDLKNNRVDLNPGMLTENAYHEVGCKNKQLFLDPGTYENAIIHTDCAVQFRGGVILENVVIISESTDKAAFGSPRGNTGGVQIGKDDDCAPGGDALLITPGGMSFAAGITLSGGQLIAGGDVEFSAQGSGVDGGQITAGGSVVSTSNIHFGPCGYNDNVLGTLYPVMRQ